MPFNEWQSDDSSSQVACELVDGYIWIVKFKKNVKNVHLTSICQYIKKCINTTKINSSQKCIIFDFSENKLFESEARREFSLWLSLNFEGYINVVFSGINYERPGTVNLCDALLASVLNPIISKNEVEAVQLIKNKHPWDFQNGKGRTIQFHNLLGKYYWGRDNEIEIPEIPKDDPFNEVFSATKLFLNNHNLGQIDPPQSNITIVEKNKWESLFSQSNDAVVVFRWDRIVDLNTAMESMFGYSRDELLGLSIFDLLKGKQPSGEDSSVKAREIYFSIISTKEPQHYYWKHIRKNGESFDTHITLDMVWVAADRFGLAIIRDISELMIAQEKLREQEEAKNIAELEHKKRELTSKAMQMVEEREYIHKLREKLNEICMNNNNMITQSLQKVIQNIDTHLEKKNAWIEFESWFAEVHPDFINKLIKEYPKITPGELKLCALLKLNLRSKEIATIMQLTLSTIEEYRRRLRKKLNVPSSANLVNFISKI